MKVSSVKYHKNCGQMLIRGAYSAEQVYASQSARVLSTVRDLLSIRSQPQDDYNSIRELRTPGTCQTLVQEEIFASWMQHSTSAGILWLHAGPGSGKSVKASFLIDHISSLGHYCQYYFFRYQDALKRSVNTFFRSLAFQLCQDMPRFRSALLKLADDNALAGKTHTRQIWKMLFESNLFSLDLHSPVYWVIDAVDESDSPEVLISILKSIPRTMPIRIILISRHLPSMSSSLNRFPSEVSVDEMDISNNRDDIRRFAEEESVHLPGDEGFHSKVVDQLLRRCDGNFLWVHLALQELLEIHSQEDLGYILDDLPIGMEPMYQRMENSVAQLSRPSEQSLAKSILTWTTYGRRLLHIDELSYVLQPRFGSLFDLRTSISKVCGHFVSVDLAGRVCLVHSTAQDYLRHASGLPFAFDSRSAHEDMLDISIHRLLDPRLRSRLDQKSLPPFCEYASSSWAYHLERSSSDSASSLSLLIKFFSGPSVLPWIEALAISRQLCSLVSASTTLSSFIQRRRRLKADEPPLSDRFSDPKLLEMWALDLLKVLGKFGIQLQQDPAAIYKLVPQLCPLNTAIYQHFGKSSLAQISVSGLQIVEWDDLTARLSVDSSQQASHICCSVRFLAISTSARSIMIWNTVSFHNLLTLDHNEHIFAISMSDSGELLASFGAQTTKVWNLPKGREISCISNIANMRPVALTLMENDTSLLVCTDTRLFWKAPVNDSSTGWQKAFPSIFEDGNSVEGSSRNTPADINFNGEVSSIAVAYRGAPLEVWDLYSGQILSRCKRPARPGMKRVQTWTGVNRVRWHPVEYEILGLYTDGSVFKWQPYTEAHYELAEPPDNSPSDIQIAPNGRIFLTSNVNGTVRIYNYQDLVTIYQLSSEDVITAMCFSPDSQRFYDLRGSYCNVWEPNVLMRTAELEDRDHDTGSEMRSQSSVSLVTSEAVADTSTPITCLSPSPKGRLICWGDDEGTVTIYDREFESKIQIANSAIGMGVERIAWSEDGQYLAYEDLGRRLVVLSITEQTVASPKFQWAAKRVLSRKLSLTGGMTRGLLLANDSSMVLAIGKKDAQGWKLPSPSLCSAFDIKTPDAVWFNNPRDQSQIMAVEGNTVSAFNCNIDSVRCEKICDWTIEAPFVESDLNKSARQAAVTQAAEYIMLVHSQNENQPRGSGSREIRLFQTSSLDPSKKVISAGLLPASVVELLERPLTVLGSHLFVFLDKSFWICSWRFDFQDLQVHDTAASRNELKQSGQKATQDSEALSELKVTRHFFLPQDWVNASSLALCTVMSDGTFLCPRKGEVAVIRSDLGSEE